MKYCSNFIVHLKTSNEQFKIWFVFIFINALWSTFGIPEGRVRYRYVSERKCDITSRNENYCIIRESNPGPNVGNVGFYH